MPGHTPNDETEDGTTDTPNGASTERAVEPVTKLPMTERLALSVEEAAALLGISRDLAYGLVTRGELPSVRLGRRLVVPRRALEDRLDRLADAG